MTLNYDSKEFQFEKFDKKILYPLIEEDIYYDVNDDFADENSVVIKTEGMVFGYSSPKLKEIFFKMYHNMMNNHFKITNRYLDKYEVIIPFHSSKSRLGRIFDKLLSYFSGAYIAAFYHIKLNRIFVFLTNLSSLTGYIDTDKMIGELYPLIRHEFSHFFAGNFPKRFWKVYKKIIITFYYHFLYEVFKEVLTDKAIRLLHKSFSKSVEKYFIIYKKLSKMSMEKFSMNHPMLKWWNKLFINILQKRKKEDDFYYRVLDLLNALKKFANGDFNGYVNDHYDIYQCFHQAYLKTLNVDPNDNFRSLYVQEFIIPDEIIAITNQTLLKDKKWDIFYNMVPKIKFKLFYGKKGEGMKEYD